VIDMTRRAFIGLLPLVATGTLFQLAVTPAKSAQDPPIRFVWRVPIAHRDAVQRNLLFEGSITSAEDEKGIPLVFIFAGVVLLPDLVHAVLELRREIVYGGLVIDTRGPEIEIKNDKRLPSGVIVIVTSSGTEIYERDQFADPSELIATLSKK
jgi:hypothetical protein